MFIVSEGYKNIYREYKKTPVREFCKKYRISAHTATKIFGPKISRTKKRVIIILKNEGDTRSIREIAVSNLL